MLFLHFAYAGGNAVPVINSFIPVNATKGTSVTIRGSNLLNVVSVGFGGVPASSFTVDSATGITAIVGEGASGSVTATNSFGTGSRAGFNYTGPLVSSFKPAIGNAGSVINITGVNFTGTTSVTFGGVPASGFIINSSTSISATVGSGASGAVAVTTAIGAGSRDGFGYSVPVVNSFSPASGPVGTHVIITGINFNPIPADNIVFLGGVRASVITASPTQLLVSVPAGATYKPITISCGGLTAYSRTAFQVTFTNGGPITSSSFINSYTLAPGLYPVDLLTSDLNNDGKPDVVTLNVQGNSLSVFRNNSSPGNLSFSSKTDYPTATGPSRLAVGDLDGDGRQDVVVVNSNSGNASMVSIFKNLSTGNTILLGSRIDMPTGDGSLGVTISDMNGDGRPDMIVSSSNSGYYSIFTNTTNPGGTISFSKQNYTFPDRPDAIIVADLDNDGKPDLITGNWSAATISTFKNISTTNEIIFGTRVNYLAGRYPSALSTADFDNDGKSDIIVSNYSDPSITFYKNTSNPGSISLGLGQNLSLGGAYPSTNLAIEDFNGDGKLDFAAGKYNDGTLAILENNYSTPGSFSFTAPVSMTSGNFDTHVTSCDLDGDGKPEILAANTTPSNVVIYQNQVGNSSLPVKLISFNALAVNNKILLEWTSRDETNFGHYEIQKSFDGITFNFVSTVKATDQAKYTSYDEVSRPAPARLYYRLKEIDKDGSVYYGTIVVISLSIANKVSIYPNPTREFFFFESAAKTANINFQIINSQGKVMKEGLQFPGKPVDVRELASGIYIVRILDKTQRVSQVIKMLKE